MMSRAQLIAFIIFNFVHLPLFVADFTPLPTSAFFSPSSFFAPAASFSRTVFVHAETTTTVTTSAPSPASSISSSSSFSFSSTSTTMSPSSSTFTLVSTSLLQALPNHVNIAAFCVNGTDERMLNPTGYQSQFEAQCDSFYEVFQLWQLRINQKFGGMLINGERIPVNIRYFNVGYGDNATDVRKVYAVAYRVLVNLEFGFFHAAFGPYSTAYVLPVAQLCEATKTPLFQNAGLATSLFTCPAQNTPSNSSVYAPECVGRATASRRFRYMWSAADTLENSYGSAYWSAALQQASTTAIWSSSDAGSVGMAQGAVNAAYNVRISVVDAHFESTAASSFTAVNSYISSLVSSYSDLDVLMVTTEDLATATYFVQAMEQQNWLPKMIAMSTFPNSPLFIDAVTGPAQQWFVGGIMWDYRLQLAVDPSAYSNDVWTSTLASNGLANSDAPMQFAIDFNLTMGHMPQILNGVAVGIVVACQKNFELSLASTSLTYNATTEAGLARLNSSSPASPYAAAIVQNSIYINEPSIIGLVQWNVYGRLNIGWAIAQGGAVAGEYDLLQPINSATAAIVYPLPKWYERQFMPGMWTQNEKIVVAVNSVCVLYVLILFIIIVVKSRVPVMKSASPMLLAWMMVGAISMLCSLYMWRLYETTITCAAHVWLLSIGYFLFFMPLFAKTWRLYVIFMSNKLTGRRNLTTQCVASTFIVPALVFEIALIAIWHVVAPFQAQTIVVDSLRPYYNYDACVYTDAAYTMFYISIGSKIALVVFGCMLIALARNIPSAFNETPYIGAGLYNVLFSAALLLPITTTNALSRESCFLIRSFGIMASVMVCTSVLMVPKLLQLNSNDSLHFSTNPSPTTNTTTATKPRSSSNRSDVERDRGQTAHQRTVTMPTQNIVNNNNNNTMTVAGANLIQAVELATVSLKSIGKTDIIFRRTTQQALAQQTQQTQPHTGAPPPLQTETPKHGPSSSISMTQPPFTPQAFPPHLFLLQTTHPPSSSSAASSAHTSPFSVPLTDLPTRPLDNNNKTTSPAAAPHPTIPPNMGTESQPTPVVTVMEQNSSALSAAGSTVASAASSEASTPLVASPIHMLPVSSPSSSSFSISDPSQHISFLLNTMPTTSAAAATLASFFQTDSTTATATAAPSATINSAYSTSSSSPNPRGSMSVPELVRRVHELEMLLIVTKQQIQAHRSIAIPSPLPQRLSGTLPASSSSSSSSSSPAVEEEEEEEEEEEQDENEAERESLRSSSN